VMFEDTARIQKVQKAQATTQEQLRQSSQRVNYLIELMRTRQSMLLPQGMNIPSGTLEALDTLRKRLDALADKIVREQQSELNQLRALADTTSLINSSLDMMDVLKTVMDTVIRLTGAERGYIMLKDKVTGELGFSVARGLDQEQLRADELTVSRTIVNKVAETGQPELTNNAINDPRFQEQQSVVGFGLRSILAVPLKVRDEVIGVVYCDNRIMVALFNERELEMMTAFAHQAAVAIENARLFESARARLAEITQLRDMMDNVFASITSGVVTLDNNGVINYCNPPGESILNIPVSFVIGRYLDDVLPSLNGTFAEKLQTVFETGSQERVEVAPFLDGVGQRYWNMIISPLRDDNGVSQGVTVVIDDLTEIKRREEQLGFLKIYLPDRLADNLQSIDRIDVGGQELEITAIFADVRGFTSFSQDMEPEKLMVVINQYLSVASDAIGLYEGVVDKYMGDAVTGLFNTQFNMVEDHAVKAVQAALHIRFDLRELHEELPPEHRLCFGIGIHTGMAVLGNVGSKDRKEFAALGEAADMSKLLQENAQVIELPDGRKEGEIIISAETYERVKNYFDCEALTPRKTKDHPNFTVMYRVIQRKRRTTGTMAAKV
jgi:adenylate cyclase